MTGRPPSPGSGDTLERRVVGLSRDVERTGRQVRDLDQLVRRLASAIDALAHGSQAGAPEAGGGATRQPVGVRSWLLVEDAERAELDLVDLVEWLDRVYLAYPLATLPTCWLWHPTVVEELWWLRCAHADAYHPTTGSWARVGDWHDRLRPNVVERLKKEATICEVLMHTAERKTDTASQLRTPVRSAVPTMAAWTAAGRPDPAPEPTAEDLEQAKQFQRDKYGGRW